MLNLKCVYIDANVETYNHNFYYNNYIKPQLHKYKTTENLASFNLYGNINFNLFLM